MPIGTIVNAGAVIVGSLIGLTLKKSLPDKIKAIILDGFGLVTVFLGIKMSLEVKDVLIIIFAMVIGAILGEAIDLEKYFEKFGNFLKAKVGSKETRFTEGLLAAFILYCIGPLTVVGSINEGLRGDRSLLLTKSVLDGFTSIAFATTYGIGVLFSAVPLFIYQSLLTIGARWMQGIFSEMVVAQLTAMGGILIIGVGINLLNLKKIKVTNLLPALLVVVILTLIFK